MVWGRKDKDEKRRDDEDDVQETGARAGEPREGGLEQQIEELTAQRDEANQKYLRTLADYQNSQRRAVGNEQEARKQAVTSVVLSVLPVIDHFELALGQDPGKVNVEQLMAGVRVIRDELMRVLQKYGVELVHPQPNDEFDPTRHQAVVQQDVEDVEPGNIVATLQAGYVMGERLIRPATVSVRPRIKGHELPEPEEDSTPPT